MNRELDQGQLKDRLPDLLHGTLPDSERAVVEAAVHADPGLARELQAVRAAQAALTPRAIAIDADQVMRAVRQGRASAKRGGLNASQWRIAAVALLAVGVGSVALVQRQFHVFTPVAAVDESTHVAGKDPLSISFGYDLSDLSSADFDKVVSDLEKSGGVPSSEPRTPAAISAAKSAIGSTQ